tara:strand:- start:51 stop:239 length:189 start_codon:yes stop_codon:yes gene_type:complete
MRQKIDAILNRYVSRKLMVFVIACFGMFSGMLNSSEFTNIAIMYVGTQGAIDAIVKLRNKTN